MKNTTILKSGQIRKHNLFLKNWAKSTNSDELADLILSGIISTKTGKAVLKG